MLTASVNPLSPAGLIGACGGRSEEVGDPSAGWSPRPSRPLQARAASQPSAKAPRAQAPSVNAPSETVPSAIVRYAAPTIVLIGHPRTAARTTSQNQPPPSLAPSDSIALTSSARTTADDQA